MERRDRGRTGNLFIFSSKSNFVPKGWDIGTPHLALVDVVEREKVLVDGKKVLVPGAG